MKKGKVAALVVGIVAVLAVAAYFTVDYFLDKDLERQQQELAELENNHVSTKSGEDVETELCNFEDGRFYLKVPKSFSQMDADMIALKYPNGEPPKYVFTNEETTINVAVGVSDAALEDSQVQQFVDYMEQGLSQSQQGLDTNVYEKSGRTVGELRFVSEAADTDIYNHMLVFSDGGQQRVVTFNCTVENQEEWQPVGSFIVQSLHFPAEG